MGQAELRDLVRHKVENLRPKLLDLSRRNPLLSTKLTPRSNAHIRVVDELPEVLFYKLNNAQIMRLVPLPDIDLDPKDEDTKRFRDALSAARLTDEAYLKALENVDRDADDYVDRTKSIERALKDRVRVELGLAARPKQADVNLAQHARNNGITPSYDLPSSGDKGDEARHVDDDIQTLLLPKDLERKLNSISSKCRTWIQETGINVLHVAYGFLEWSEPGQTDTAFAPLVLSSAQIEKKRSREGVEFRISGVGEEPEVNAVLAEKMRIDFGIELPPFDGSSVEAYMAAIAEVAPKKIVWKVRRQVAIGVFPSARMAMYHDIDPKRPEFPDSDIVRALLAGSANGGDAPFAEEYNVDEPAIESRVPYLVMDADSSQFSTLVDIAHGRNLAVEGPPGTGKSQTIVNAIAAALAEGKKVLFVAEKLAALNVVRSRLESIGLGEFLLPLQAERSTREQVIASVRERVEMRAPAAARDYDQEIASFRRTRQQLADYIQLLTLPFGASGLTIHEILSRSIATENRLAGIPQEILELSKIPLSLQNKADIKRLSELGDAVEKAAAELAEAKTHWRGTFLLHPDRFTVEEACNLAIRSADTLGALGKARDALVALRMQRDLSDEMLLSVRAGLERELELTLEDRDLRLRLLTDGAVDALQNFIECCDQALEAAVSLKRTVAAPLDESTHSKILQLAEICTSGKLETLDWALLQARLASRRDALLASRDLADAMKPLIQIHSEARGWPLRGIASAFAAIRSAGRSVLACRNAATNDPAALGILRQLITEGRALQNERAGLSKRVSLTVEAPLERLTDIVVILRSGGALAFLSGRFREAKRHARALSLAERFDKSDVLARLESLTEYRIRERAFCQNPQAAALFGLNFRGVDTEFGPFEALVKYYDSLASSLAGPEMRGLRNFLRDADLDELEAVPNIPPDTPVETLESLQLDQTAAFEEITKTVDALKALRPLLPLFHSPATVTPTSLSALAAQLEKYLEACSVLNADESVSSLLGSKFAGVDTKIAELRPACEWARSLGLASGIVATVLRSGDAKEAIAAISRVESEHRQASSNLAQLGKIACIDPTLFTDGRDEAAAAAALYAAGSDPEGLFAHANLATTLVELDEFGTKRLVSHRLTEGVPKGLGPQLEALAIRTLARAAYAEHRNKLSRFTGTKLDELRSTLARQDRQLIKLAQKQLRRQIHGSAKPPYGNGVGKKSTWTQMALVDNEINKQQRFISVRDLTQRAGQALLELKPCWMMSPLAVAQYVPKEAIKFDLCIIDEASQMPPEAAIGALLRCGQTVVVGDTNQLPPSSFFRKMIDDEEADEDDTVLNESVLEMANATFRPARRLRWHYRSRHSGLIKFSNRLVYDNDLIVFPSATESMARMGVEFQKVDGLYKSGANPAEARAVVDAILEFMRTDPNRSLGVVTLNQKQRELIAEEFDHAIAADQQAQAYVEAWKEKNDGLEEFFIKNLENVQGDERDVIFIGTVYGPESRGARVAQRFGPINGLAGKRRLNVLFSRAKEKIVTFSSMTAADVVAEEGGNAGAYMLKRWLEYSATGVIEGGVPDTREPGSEFEVFVMAQIKAMGCEPVPQVGVAGYFIDIGVRHPQWPYGFVLGVECDGASYHSAKSARDRDRLRQEVLERLGWHFHRIWSTDWFNNPRREGERLREAIAQRLAALKSREAEFSVGQPVHRSTEVILDTSEPSEQRDPAPTSKPAASDDAERQSKASANRQVSVGDTVRVRYLTGDNKTLIFTISADKSDVPQGIIHRDAPIARALLGAEEGDEVEVLSGPYVRPAIVESIERKITESA